MVCTSQSRKKQTKTKNPSVYKNDTDILIWLFIVLFYIPMEQWSFYFLLVNIVKGERFIWSEEKPEYILWMLWLVVHLAYNYEVNCNYIVNIEREGIVCMKYMKSVVCIIEQGKEKKGLSH